MADYKLNGVDDSSGVIRNSDGASIPNAPGNRDWREYIEWIENGGIPDPQYTTEEQNVVDYNNRQNERIKVLKQALIDQFKMILALFQVGRNKGLWVVADFDPLIVTKAQAWIDLIDEYENDEPGAE